MKGRFDIDFSGYVLADVSELFPNPDDPEDPAPEHVDDVLDGVTLRTFLGEWNYGEALEVEIRDRETEARWRWDGMRQRFVRGGAS